MPTVKRIRGYRFFFFSNEGFEPPHIHVETGEQYAKFWLDPVQLTRNVGFDSKDLTKLRKLIIQYQNLFLEAWHDYFNS